jgi:hypothetical protein
MNAERGRDRNSLSLIPRCKDCIAASQNSVPFTYDRNFALMVPVVVLRTKERAFSCMSVFGL